MNAPAQLSMPDPLLDDLEASGTHRFTGPEGRRISWRTWGAGKPLVFLHGGSGSWKHWVRQIGAFAGDRLVVVPDLPGYGLSDQPAEPIRFIEMGRDLAAGLDEILGGPLEYDLVAFSYGGSITAQLLAVQPGRQSSVVLCAAAGFATPQLPPMKKVRGLEGDALVDTHRFNLGSIMIADPGRIDPLALRIQHENTMQSRLRAMKLDRGLTLVDTLPGFTGRICAIWGTEDAFMKARPPSERGRALREMRPDAEVHMLDGIGHWLAYEAPDQVNAILSEFLAKEATS